MAQAIKQHIQLSIKHNILYKNLKLIYPLLCNSQCDSRLSLNEANFHTSTLLHKKLFLPMKPKLKKMEDKYIAQLSPNMTVKEVANELKRPLPLILDALTHLPGSAYITSSNDVVPIDMAACLAKQAGVKHRRVKGVNVKTSELFKMDKPTRPTRPQNEVLVPRQPVVTIMGHVDHGKTTLLDYLRKSSIVDQEFGGITQHIGAFEVGLPNGQKVTFIDTPGHATFKELRARGAMLTDIIVLVVAADDGVMPQTVESLELANASNVPIVVAINKIDKQNSNIDTCRKSLLHAGIQVEEHGGDVQSIGISALKGLHIDELIEALLVQAELMDVRASPTGPVEAFILEAKGVAQSKNQPDGVSATILVQQGTLRPRNILVAGTSLCKVRSMYNDSGHIVKEVLPGKAAQVYGFDKAPNAGDAVHQYKEEKSAKQVIKTRLKEETEQKSNIDAVAISQKRQQHQDDYFQLRKQNLISGIMTRKGSPIITYEGEGEMEPLSLVLKCDADGSLEAITNVMATYESNVLPMKVGFKGIGPITDHDLFIAESMNGIIYTFNIATSANIKKLLHDKNIPLREHNIIYRLVETLKDDISSRLPLLDFDDVKGEAVVLSEFMINDLKNKKRPVAGCKCVKGTLTKKYRYKVMRGNVVIETNCEAESIRNLKTEVSSIKEGKECGIMLTDREVRFKMDDKLYCYEQIKKAQQTDWEPPGFH